MFKYKIMHIDERYIFFGENPYNKSLFLPLLSNADKDLLLLEIKNKFANFYNENKTDIENIFEKL